MEYHLNKAVKDRIIKLHNNGYKLCDIASTLRLSFNIVKKVLDEKRKKEKLDKKKN